MYSIWDERDQLIFMNNKDLPIKTKTPERILAIAKAKSVKSYDFSKSKFTDFWENLDDQIQDDLSNLFESNSEIGYLHYYRNRDNWTLLTSHRLVGKKDGDIQIIDLKNITSRDFGMVKNMDNVPLIFKVSSRLGNHEFEYESNGPGLAFMVSLDFIQDHWERNVIDKTAD